MLQGERELGRPTRSARRVGPQGVRERVDGVPVIGGREPSTLADEVVHEADPVPRRHRTQLVDAVGVEGTPRDLGRVLAAQVEPHVAVTMTNDELASLVGRREHDHQRGEHAVHLLGVAVLDEEAPCIVDEEFVELRADRSGHAEPVCCVRDDGVEGAPPTRADGHAGSRNLPDLPDSGIDEGLAAATARSCMGR
jgi:hypothetical protein